MPRVSMHTYMYVFLHIIIMCPHTWLHAGSGAVRLDAPKERHLRGRRRRKRYGDTRRVGSYMHVFLHACMNVCIDTNACLYESMCVRTNTHSHPCWHLRFYLCTPTLKVMFVCIFIYRKRNKHFVCCDRHRDCGRACKHQQDLSKYLHIYMHTHTCICVLQLRREACHRVRYPDHIIIINSKGKRGLLKHDAFFHQEQSRQNGSRLPFVRMQHANMTLHICIYVCVCVCVYV